MKLKDGFFLRKIAGQTVVLPSGGDLDMNLMITLNDTGAFLWRKLQCEIDEASLITALQDEYDVDEPRATAAIAKFIRKLRDNGFLE